MSSQCFGSPVEDKAQWNILKVTDFFFVWHSLLWLYEGRPSCSLRAQTQAMMSYHCEDETFQGFI